MVKAENVYTANDKTQNGYYQRSQHTYSYKDLEEKNHNDYAAGLYILYANENDAKDAGNFDFKEKFGGKYTLTEDAYYLAYCADINVAFMAPATYKRIFIKDYEGFSDETKRHLSGIVKNAYPFISYDEMVQKLLDAGVMVKAVNANEEEVITSTTNVEKSPGKKYYISLTDDELLSATQMAIFNFTNPGQVTSLYYQTQATLKNNPVFADYEYQPKANYPVAQRNIQAIYDYLITLEDDYETKFIDHIDAQIVEDETYIRVAMSRALRNDEEFKLELSKDGKVIQEINLKDCDKDKNGNYIALVKDLSDVSDVKIRLIGKAFVENAVDIYENVLGASESQLLLGLSSLYRDIDMVYEGEVFSATDIYTPNPNTATFVSTAIVVVALVSAIGIIYSVKKKSFYR